MSPKKLTPAEFRTEDEEEAELVAFLSNRISFYDKKEETYNLITQDDILSKIEELYDEDRYGDAEELIDAYDQYSSFDPEKEIKKVKSKSFRLSKVQFVQAVKKAYDRNISISDILRSNIGNRIKSNFQNLYQNSELQEKRVEQLEEVVKNWSKKEGRLPLKEGYRLNFGEYPISSKEKYENFAKYFLKKTILKEKLKDEKLIDVFTKYYTIKSSDEIFSDASLRIKDDNGGLNIIFNDKLSLILDFDSRDERNNLLSDIANLGYSEKKLEKSPIFDDHYWLLEMVQWIKDRDLDKEDIHDRSKWDELEKTMSNPYLKIKIPLEAKAGKIIFGGEPLEEKNVKDRILNNIFEGLDVKLKFFDINEAKEDVKEYIRKKDTNSAKKVNQKISLFVSSKYIAGIIGEIILDGLSSQVVSLTMPRGVSGLLKIFDLKKEDILW